MQSNETFCAEDWEKILNKYPRLMNIYYDQVWNAFLKYIDNLESYDILDLGCGDGEITCRFAKSIHNKGDFTISPKNIVGVDMSYEMLSQACEKARRLGVSPKFIHCSIESLKPISNNSFNLVISSAVLHHIKNKNKVFSEISRVMRNGGKLLLIDVMFENENEKE